MCVRSSRTEPYVVEGNTARGFMVVHRGPTVVAKDLKRVEAIALANALNEGAQRNGYAPTRC